MPISVPIFSAPSRPFTPFNAQEVAAAYQEPQIRAQQLQNAQLSAAIQQALAPLDIEKTKAQIANELARTQEFQAKNDPNSLEKQLLQNQIASSSPEFLKQKADTEFSNKKELQNSLLQGRGAGVDWLQTDQGFVPVPKTTAGGNVTLGQAIMGQNSQPLMPAAKITGPTGNALLKLNADADTLAPFGFVKENYENPTQMQTSMIEKKMQLGNLSPQQQSAAAAVVSELDRNPVIKTWQEAMAKGDPAISVYNKFIDPKIPKDQKPGENNVDQALIDANTSIITGRSPTVAQVVVAKDFIPFWDKMEATAKNFLGLRGSGSTLLPQARQDFVNSIKDYQQALHDSAAPEIRAGQVRLNSAGVGIGFYTGVRDPNDRYDAIILGSQAAPSTSSQGTIEKNLPSSSDTLNSLRDKYLKK